MDRVRYWKDEAERRWREGDRKGFAEAEAMLEAYRMKEQLEREEREREQQEQERMKQGHA